MFIYFMPERFICHLVETRVHATMKEGLQKLLH